MPYRRSNVGSNELRALSDENIHRAKVYNISKEEKAQLRDLSRALGQQAKSQAQHSGHRQESATTKISSKPTKEKQDVAAGVLGKSKVVKRRKRTRIISDKYAKAKRMKAAKAKKDLLLQLERDDALPKTPTKSASHQDAETAGTLSPVVVVSPVREKEDLSLVGNGGLEDQVIEDLDDSASMVGEEDAAEISEQNDGSVATIDGVPAENDQPQSVGLDSLASSTTLTPETGDKETDPATDTSAEQKTAQAHQIILDAQLRTLQDVTKEVLQPNLLLLKHTLPTLDFMSYLAAWNALRARGIAQKRFDHEMEKLLVTEERKHAHEEVKSGVALMEQMVALDGVLGDYEGFGL